MCVSVDSVCESVAVAVAVEGVSHTLPTAGSANVVGEK